MARKKARGEFSKCLAGQKHVDNHPEARAAKLELRNNILLAIGQDRAQVLDCFAGSGGMYRGIWRRAAGYVGMDERWFPDTRLAYVGDNRRILRAIDLSPFNIFDLDAWGSPWEQAIIIGARRVVRPGQRIGMLFTDGTALKMRMGGMTNALAELAGISGPVAGASRAHHDLISMALTGLARRMSCTLTGRWQALGATNAAVRYIGIIMVGNDGDGAESEVNSTTATAEKYTSGA